MRYALKMTLTACFLSSIVLASPTQKNSVEAVQWGKELKNSYLPQDEWIEMVSKRTDAKAINWVQEQLKSDPLIAKKKQSLKDISLFGNKQCINRSIEDEADSPLYVLISFSVPKESWMSLSTEMEKTGGAFILKGIPDNSFKTLSQKILLLNDLGVTAPIRIDPNLFDEFEVNSAPTIVLKGENGYDKITGNVSIAYALKRMSIESESSLAKKMLLQLGET